MLDSNIQYPRTVGGYV